MGYQVLPEFGKVHSAWLRFSKYARQRLNGVEDPKLQDPNLLSFPEFIDHLRRNRYRLAVSELLGMDIDARPLMDMAVSGDGTRLADFAEWINYTVAVITVKLDTDPQQPEPLPDDTDATAPQPEDLTAYVEASIVWREHLESYDKFKTCMDKRPSIRRKSAGQRYHVHAAAWLRYWKRHGEQAEEGTVPLAFIQQQARYEQLHEKKEQNAPKGRPD